MMCWTTTRSCWASDGNRRRLGARSTRRTRRCRSPARHVPFGTTSSARAAWTMTRIDVAGMRASPGAAATVRAPIRVCAAGGEGRSGGPDSAGVHGRFARGEAGRCTSTASTRPVAMSGPKNRRGRRDQRTDGLGVSAGAVYVFCVRPRPDRSGTNDKATEIYLWQSPQGPTVEAAGQVLGPHRKGRRARRRGHGRQHPASPSALPFWCTDLGGGLMGWSTRIAPMRTPSAVDPASGSVTTKVTVADPMQISAASAGWVAAGTASCGPGVCVRSPSSATVPGFAPGWVDPGWLSRQCLGAGSLAVPLPASMQRLVRHVDCERALRYR